jgi:hypothetical protein
VISSGKNDGTRNKGPNYFATRTCPLLYNQRPNVIYQTKTFFTSKVNRTSISQSMRSGFARIFLIAEEKGTWQPWDVSLSLKSMHSWIWQHIYLSIYLFYTSRKAVTTKRIIICSLFNGAFSNSYYIASNNRATANDELKRMWMDFKYYCSI